MPNSKQLKNKEVMCTETEDKDPDSEQKLELISAECTITNQEKLEHLLDKMNVVAEKIKRNKKKSKLSKVSKVSKV